MPKCAVLNIANKEISSVLNIRNQNFNDSFWNKLHWRAMQIDLHRIKPAQFYI
jgi:hypothetical protein